MTRHCQMMRAKIANEWVLKSTEIHAVKVQVWAEMSKRGTTSICIFDPIMDGMLHTQLGSVTASFHRETISWQWVSSEYCFLQDPNNPKHTSGVAKDFYQKKGINWWPTSTSSVDINPIEHVWRQLKHFIAFEQEKLIVGICSCWKSRMTPDKCIKYINHTFTLLPKVVVKEVWITGDWRSLLHLAYADTHYSLHAWQFFSVK